MLEKLILKDIYKIKKLVAFRKSLLFVQLTRFDSVSNLKRFQLVRLGS